MKPHILSAFLLICCLVATQLMTQRVWAQSASASMTLDQLNAVKKIKINNLEKDTYFKADGFILDRYEERPAYVFNYSDGITRKIYLYKIYTATDTKELGLLAVYQNGKTNEIKPFVIPGANADRKAWDAYIDDLKYVGEKEAGLMSALGFVISREMSVLLAGGSGKVEEGGKKKEEYNFCFPGDAVVTLADRQTKAIQAVKEGEEVLAYDANSKKLVSTRVKAVQLHEKGGLEIAGVWLTPVEEISASRQPSLTKPVLLEATANHPVQTTTGRKKLGDLTAGEVVYRYEGATGSVTTWKVARVEPVVRTVNKVYNLETERGSYLINDVVVLDK